MARYRSKLTETGTYTYKTPRKRYIEDYSIQDLRNEVKKLVSQTNKRLDNLVVDINKGKYNPKTKRFERKNTVTFIDEKGTKRKKKITNVVDYRHTFESKKLEELENYKYKENKIVLTGNETKEQLLEIRKKTSNFLKAKTSTVSGIREVEKGIKSTISSKLDEYEVTPEESDALYKLFEDKDFIALRKYLDPSEIQALLLEVRNFKQELYSKEEVYAGENPLIDDEINSIASNKFKELFIEYAGLDESSLGRDIDLQNSLLSLYNKIDALL